VPENRDVARVEHELGEELLRLHRESYGKGARVSRVHYLDDTIICLLDDVELLPNEEFLIGAGHGDAVVEVRSRYQQAIETVFRAAVERATGRRVVSFVSATKLSPHWVMEVFRLGPATIAELQDPDDA
jgi:uncharacterized protein YbcI